MRNTKNSLQIFGDILNVCRQHNYLGVEKVIKSLHGFPYIIN